MNQLFERTTKQEQKAMAANSFWGFFDDLISRCKDGSRVHIKKGTPMAVNTTENFENLYRILRLYEKAKKTLLTFENIDINFHKSFTGYLTVDRKLKINTKGKLITLLKIIMREAVEMGKHTNMAFSYRMFKSFSEPSNTIYLNDAEINELIALDLSASQKLDAVRDVFIVGCYTGLRFSDLSQLGAKNITDGMIDITTIKTNTKVIIPVQNEVAKVLAKYGGTMPEVISNQKFNDYLKVICEMCELLKKDVEIEYYEGSKKCIELKQKHTLVSSHTARRSFATNEFDKGDLQVFEIKAITGHATDKSFYAYIRKTAKETALKTADIWRERELKAAQPLPILRKVV